MDRETSAWLLLYTPVFNWHAPNHQRTKQALEKGEEGAEGWKLKPKSRGEGDKQGRQNKGGVLDAAGVASLGQLSYLGCCQKLRHLQVFSLPFTTSFVPRPSPWSTATRILKELLARNVRK